MNLTKAFTRYPSRLNADCWYTRFRVLGIRSLDGRKITFCTDTGICDNAVILSKNADLLITECGLKPGEESPEWPHLNPEQAVSIAKDAHAKRLALIHFAPHKYATLKERFEIQERYHTEFPSLIVATDDLEIEI